ncbi:MAG: putative transporter component [Gemmatimonadetes bacterium]|nr:putative transporter component [Gemmatimonadota bacterium]
MSTAIAPDSTPVVDLAGSSHSAVIGVSIKDPSDTPVDSSPATGRPYANPYLAGVGIGLVLLAAFVVAGRGLGASGAFSSAVAAGTAAFAPSHAAANPALAEYLGDGVSVGPLRDWLVFELAGVALGGFASAALAGRLRGAVERGPRIGSRGRLAYAMGGGVVMGVGARLARGCTSGQALTGGALLAVGGWIFIVTAFAAAYLAGPLFRRQWT